jgi:hypothetical protein
LRHSNNVNSTKGKRPRTVFSENTCRERKPAVRLLFATPTNLTYQNKAATGSYMWNVTILNIDKTEILLLFIKISIVFINTMYYSEQLLFIAFSLIIPFISFFLLPQATTSKSNNFLFTLKAQ